VCVCVRSSIEYSWALDGDKRQKKNKRECVKDKGRSGGETRTVDGEGLTRRHDETRRRQRRRGVERYTNKKELREKAEIAKGKGEG